MAGNPKCTVYIGNLDERVSDRVLYDILIQAGRVVDLYIPRDKETDRPKGFAFAEYESEEIANYAVKLFSGLVTLYNRTLKFGISGQDKPSSNNASAATPSPISSLRSRPYPSPSYGAEVPSHSLGSSTSSRFPMHPVNYEQGHDFNGCRSRYDGHNYDYTRRVFGATMDSINRSRSGRNDSSNSISYPSY